MSRHTRDREEPFIWLFIVVTNYFLLCSTIIVLMFVCQSCRYSTTFSFAGAMSQRQELEYFLCELLVILRCSRREGVTESGREREREEGGRRYVCVCGGGGGGGGGDRECVCVREKRVSERERKRWREREQERESVCLRVREKERDREVRE